MTQIRTSAVILFSLAAVLILSSFVADRLGAPAEITVTVILALGALCLGVAGLSFATMRVSMFQSAGHAVSVSVMVAILSVTGLGLAATSGAAASGLSPGLLLAGASACLFHALLTAAPLARAGGYSFGDVIHARFGSRLIAIVVAMVGLALGLALLLAVSVRAVAAFTAISGGGRAVAAGTVAVLACLLAVPGGARSLAAGSVVALLLALTGWALPAVALFGEPGPSRLALVERAAGNFFEGVVPSLDGFGWVMVALGLVTFLHVSAMTAEGERARRSYSLTVIVLIALAAAAALAHALSGGATARLGTLPADRLPPIVFSDHARGQITFCGVAARNSEDVRKACALAAPSDVVPIGRIRVVQPDGGRWMSIILRLPVAIGTVFDLAVPMLLIATFAMLAHFCARCIVHDILYRLTARTGTSSGRLALQRLVTMALIGAAILVAQRPLALDGPVLHLLFFLAASVPWPLALLACWSRADWRAALCGLASAAIAGLAHWLGWLPDAAGFAAGALASLAAGALAAAVFPARDVAARHASDVLAGRVAGPLVLDKSA